MICKYEETETKIFLPEKNIIFTVHMLGLRVSFFKPIFSII
jgi:hypothetical protein